ncbi:hypothetical protein [Peribacillus frigoritolerans]|uniref:hypothetical protein n=1 Tax=Peribacillus frigoritolerans TaxID=450367 RepID=UPI003D076BA4
MKYTIDIYKMIYTTHRLKKDGSFKEINSQYEKDVSDDDYTFDDYYEARQWKEKQTFVEVDGKRLEVNPTSSGLTDPSVTIRPHRSGKPKKSYITKAELQKVLLAGNDNYNNSLVIDFDGYLHLVPFKQAINEPYAVRFETFGAGNGYVGRESSLNHIDDTYLALLQSWAIHLTSHDQIYRDYTSRETEEETLSEILESIEKL